MLSLSPVRDCTSIPRGLLVAGILMLAGGCMVDRSAQGGPFVRSDQPASTDDDESEISDDDADDGDEERPDEGDDEESEQPDGESEPVAGDGDEEEAVAALTSPAVEQGGEFAPLNTCSGDNVSPGLSWTPGPAETLSYAVVLRDLDATALGSSPVLWVVWNIPPSVTELPEQIAAGASVAEVEGASQLSMGLGVLRYVYQGPCAWGDHHYEFARYALSTDQITASGFASPLQMETAIIDAGVLEKLTLSASYDL
jgi:Raf kinase inhibitor-like YbhB/YbcL family protein